MKNLTKIIESVYQKTWLITPSMHESIRRQLENVLSGNITMIPDEDEDEKEDKLSLINEGSMIGIVSVDGIIGKHLSLLETKCGGVDCDSISEQLKNMEEDPNVTSILMYFNTPGGTVSGVPELSSLISEIDKKKKCTAYVDVICASAGFYLASQCSSIFVSPTAELGSVGVYSIYFDESVALSNEGIKVNAIYAGKYKLTGAPFKVMTDEERAMLQADIDKIYIGFKSAVTSKRDIKDEDLQGQIFSGEDLISKNFADGQVNSMREMLTILTTT